MKVIQGGIQRDYSLEGASLPAGKYPLQVEKKGYKPITIEVARMVREVFLQQNAYDPVDTYCDMGKQSAMLTAIRKYSEYAYAAQAAGVLLPQIIAVKSKGELPQIKFIRDYKTALEKIMTAMEAEFAAMRAG